MDILVFVLEALVVLGCIIMGTRAGGVGVGLWGGVGTFLLVFVFREAPGSPPSAALAIILAVVTAAAMMQAAGGIDWMVAVAARVIQRHPKQITLIAPLTAFAFSVGAGTSNIIYPLLPVIYDVSYKNGIRPSRPLTLTVVQSGIALAASPVSAAMAAMVTLTEVAPYNLGLTQILAITLPACLVGIVVTSLVVNRLGKDLDDDPQVQAKIAAGELAHWRSEGEKATTAVAASSSGGGGAGSSGTRGSVKTGEPAGTAGGGATSIPQPTYTARGRNSALTFFAGVLAIVLLGLFPVLRPSFPVEGGDPVPIDMTTTIVMVMFVVGVLILFIGRPDVKTVPDMSVFKAGMISAIALFGIAWLTATFISAHEEVIVDTIGGWVNNWVFIFALAVFLVAALTTSQSTATRTIVPIGLAAGLAPGIVTGMWAGALGGVYTLPANGTQIAAANFDLSGTTKLGTKLVDHSFFVPMLVLSVVTILVGSLIGAIFFR
ncbi:anaerobic C4-dicarboxylate transporter DcuA/anaerobic C4-dicarboxylate transporter DcuB [Microbacterium sp. SLBN-154]|uniref:anaerobic C4-dicarboxylate transporter family protein n=1 Tax=Microbacterium sp. SLBN-154 TaxID=2768458 RepID=UPI00114E9055|nr:anaerobic C4-dicarboxylate transporter family protein [Microbacterium sp. SLBN-154]TQK19095.1 anaerobic C4-dicarboxylate transporter DcuA/anaerobic C4-dicarboxylate transporter DcuB [Microbacterium sp. SLBN-154]